MQNFKYADIIQAANSSATGLTGVNRAMEVKRILDTRLENYSEHTGYSKEEILNALENCRKTSVISFYTEHKLRMIGNHTEKVYVFDTVDEFFEKYPERKYTCPSCKKESSKPYECTESPCGWKVYGLLGDLGEGIYIVIKETFLSHPFPDNIFKPVAIKD